MQLHPILYKQTQHRNNNMAPQTTQTPNKFMNPEIRTVNASFWKPLHETKISNNCDIKKGKIILTVRKSDCYIGMKSWSLNIPVSHCMSWWPSYIFYFHEFAWMMTWPLATILSTIPGRKLHAGWYLWRLGLQSCYDNGLIFIQSVVSSGNCGPVAVNIL